MSFSDSCEIFLGVARNPFSSSIIASGIPSVADATITNPIDNVSAMLNGKPS